LEARGALANAVEQLLLEDGFGGVVGQLEGVGARHHGRKRRLLFAMTRHTNNGQARMEVLQTSHGKTRRASDESHKLPLFGTRKLTQHFEQHANGETVVIVAVLGVGITLECGDRKVIGATRRGGRRRRRRRERGEWFTTQTSFKFIRHHTAQHVEVAHFAKPLSDGLQGPRNPVMHQESHTQRHILVDIS